jgi:cation transport regulator ChaC
MKQQNCCKGRCETMTECLLVCRSLTYAQRTHRALERAGLRAYITRVKPNETVDGGCGYAVRIPENSLTRAWELLEERDLLPQKIYTVLEDGRYQEKQP